MTQIITCNMFHPGLSSNLFPSGGEEQFMGIMGSVEYKLAAVATETTMYTQAWCMTCILHAFPLQLTCSGVKPSMQCGLVYRLHSDSCVAIDNWWGDEILESHISHKNIPRLLPVHLSSRISTAWILITLTNSGHYEDVCAEKGNFARYKDLGAYLNPITQHTLATFSPVRKRSNQIVVQKAICKPQNWLCHNTNIALFI